MRDRSNSTRGKEPFIQPSRREIVVGGGAAVVSPQVAFSESSAPTVEWTLDRDDRKWGLVVRYVGKEWRLKLRDFGRGANFETVASSDKRVSIVVAGCHFPGKTAHAYIIRFDITPIKSGWQLRMEPGAWLPGWAGKSAVVPLKPFMQDGKAVAFRLNKSQGGALAQQLLGRRLEILSSTEALFSTPDGWSWTAPEGGIVSLKDAVRIKSLALRIARAGEDDGASFQSRAGDAVSDALVAVATLYGDAGVISMRGQGDDPSLELRPDNSKPVRVAFRQWGDADATAAFMRAGFQVAVSNAGIDTSIFKVEDGLLVRKDVDVGKPKGTRNRERDDVVLDRFDGILAPKDYSIATAYGHFVVKGDDLQTAKVDATKADLTASFATSGSHVAIANRAGAFNEFEVRGQLSHYALALPDGLQNGGSSSGIWSRLDFSGTEIAFVLAANPQRRPKPRNARAVVEIGRPASDRNWSGVDVPEGDAPVEIALDGAVLMVRRPEDLLALNFRFEHLNLQVCRESARIIPANRHAVGGAGTSAASDYGASTPFDDRALLIVEFPPQHVAEVAYLRQVNDGIAVPELPSDVNVDDLAMNVRSGTLQERKQKRLRAQKNLGDAHSKQSNGDKEWGEYEAFLGVQTVLSIHGNVDAGAAWPDNVDAGAARDALLARWNTLPIDQRIYLGTDPGVADPDARTVIREIWRAIRITKMQSADATLDDLAGELPDVVLEPAIERSILLRLQAKDKKALSPDNPAAADQPAAIDAIEAVKTGQDFDYGQARTAWKATQQANFADLTAFDQYRGRAKLKAFFEKSPAATQARVIKLAQAVGKALADAMRDTEAFPAVTPARLSGPSRLAFRIDGSFTSLADPDRPGPAWIPFTLLNLTRWGAFDLAVIRRAERYYKNAGGRLPIPNLRIVGGDAGEILAFQGIRPGRTISDRMSDVRTAAATLPSASETAIELPFRLLLSPSQEGRFRTPQPIPDAVFDPPEPSRIRPPLWTAALETGVGSPDVRAVASADFLPSAFAANGAEPNRGPWPPWVRDASGGPPGAPPERFRTGLDAYDRHELVGLTSVYGLPVLGRYDANGQITDGSQFTPPPGYRLKGLSTLPGFGDQSAIYRPQPLRVTELRLSALGGSLNVSTDFVPPTAALDANAASLFPAFSIERWRQRTALGRDLEVEVVYKGFLYPLGFKATLVKLTERRFMLNKANGCYTAFLIQRFFIRVGERDKAFPAIGQADGGRRFPAKTITMVTTQTPDIIDPNSAPALKEVSVLVERTSGEIVVPPSPGRSKNPGLVFWPRTSPGPTSNVGFTFLIEGNADAATMPLIFVDNAAANDVDTLEKLATYYNSDAEAARRTIKLGGTQRRYAEERKAGEASHETFQWILRVEGRKGPRVGLSASLDDTLNESFVADALLQGADQPPFYPLVASADIRVGAAERFVGHPLGVRTVVFPDQYVKKPLPKAPPPGAPVQATAPGGDIYLQLVKPLKLDMGQAGDQGGGIGRVAQDVYWLSRSVGPVGYTPESPGAAIVVPSLPTPSIKDFFSGDAKLLGIISFSEILANAAGQAFPQLTEAVEAATEDTVDFLRQTVIPDLLRALDVLETAWKKAGDALKQQTGVTGSDPVLDIAKIYPDVGPSLEDLKAALEEVETAQGADLIAPLNHVQESGRRFAQAIERTAQDPIAPLREELRDKFRIISQNVDSYAGIVSDTLLKSLVDAEKARNFLKDAIVDAIFNAPKSARDILLALPIPDGVSDPGAALAGELDDAAKEGLKAFVTAILTKNAISEGDVRDGLLKARDAAEQKLLAAADSELDPYVTALKAAKEDVEPLKGLLFERVFGRQGWVAQVLQAEVALEQLAKGAGRDLPQHIGAPIQEMLSAILDLDADRRFAAKAATFCNDGAKQIAAFVQMALPKADALSNLPTAVSSYGSDIGIPADDLTAIKQRIARFEERYRAARSRFTAATDLSGLCSGVADFPAVALAQLFDARRSLFTEIDNLLKHKVPAAAADAARTSLAKLVVEMLVTLGKTSVFDASAGPLKALDDLLAKVDVATPKTLTEHIVHDRIAALQKAGTDALGAPAQALAAALTTAKADLADTGKEVDATLTTLEMAVFNEGVAKLLAAEQVLTSLAGELAASASQITAVVAKRLADALRVSFKLVAEAHKSLTTQRHDAYAQLSSIGSGDTSAGILAVLLHRIAGGAKQHLADVLLVDPQPGGTDATDGLSQEDKLIDTVATAADDAAVLQAAASLVDLWKALGDPAIVRLGRQIADVITAALRGDLAQFVDLQAIRAQVEAAIRQMLPARIRRSYTFAIDLGVADALGELIKFDGDHPQLALTATGVVDLTKPTQPTFSARGNLPGFTLKLLPCFDVVTLTFAESVFTSESGKAFSLSLRVIDVKLGEEVQFLQELQAYLAAPKDGSGFFLALMTEQGRIGITAGYKLALSPISLGELYISNISLNVAAELPFDSGDARFVISVGRPEAPLVISAFPYAGAGYFGLIANSKGIVGFEASFEFGGGGGFSFGPLTGEGRITVGIFVRQISGYTELYGIFFAGGSARIACFCLSTSLLVRMTQTGSDLAGQAVFTFSFSIGITDLHFAVTVSKRQSGSSSGSGSKQGWLEGLTRFASTAVDDAGGVSIHVPPKTVATLSSTARCKGEDWAEHRRYFDPAFKAELI